MRKIFTLLLLITSFVTIAQQNPTLPVDPNVRTGKLENGLTYYIRNNGLPENRADFYIAQKVGSMQEEDNQAGLAHFLEHMAFNGTKNFPGKSMLNYLQDNGIKFGTNINAYTSFDGVSDDVYLQARDRKMLRLNLLLESCANLNIQE